MKAFFVFLLVLIVALGFLLLLSIIAIWAFERVGYHFYEYKRKRWEHEND